MSRKPSFANLRIHALVPEPAPAPAPAPGSPATGQSGAVKAPARASSREGRKQTAGFFPPDMSFAMQTLERRQGRSLQAVMTGAFNDVLRKHGKSPVGE